MSDYVRHKALRLPMTKEEIRALGVYSLYDLEDKFPELFDWKKLPRFEPAPTEKIFLDYLIEYDYGYYAGDFGKTRALTENEKEKYKPIFKQVVPNVDINKVRLVDFCWYNCSEAPDYYDETDDDFYEEV